MEPTDTDDPIAETDVVGSEFDDDLPSGGLLSFYDGLRRRIADFVARKGGRLGEPAAEALLFVPDVFVLLVRMALDRRVPKAERALFASALAYYVLPFDVFPEGIVGPMGFLDDLVLALTVLSRAFDPGLQALAEAHWSGNERLRDVTADVVESARSLLGTDLSERLDGVLARRFDVHAAEVGSESDFDGLDDEDQLEN